MDRVRRAFDLYGAAIKAGAAALGRDIDIDFTALTDRSRDLSLAEPGAISANGSCRLLPIKDGWVAVNLPRPEDLDLIPAFTLGDAEENPWEAVAHYIADQSWPDILERARLLSLAVSKVGEAQKGGEAAPLLHAHPHPGSRGADLKVIDLSALWAGPLCAGVLARAGASVIKIESLQRPDPTPKTTPHLDQRLNDQKTRMQLDFSSAADLARLKSLILEADVLVTSARPRALAGLGLAPEALFRAHPGLVWTAITAHGWEKPGAGRVGFGDDAAAAGGLVRWTQNRTPIFAGDAIADPLAGQAAAASVLKALGEGQGGLLDVAMARVAAGAAA